jgi:hypothetical protein
MFHPIKYYTDDTCLILDISTTEAGSIHFGDCYKGEADTIKSQFISMMLPFNQRGRTLTFSTKPLKQEVIQNTYIRKHHCDTLYSYFPNRKIHFDKYDWIFFAEIKMSYILNRINAKPLQQIQDSIVRIILPETNKSIFNHLTAENRYDIFELHFSHSNIFVHSMIIEFNNENVQIIRNDTSFLTKKAIKRLYKTMNQNVLTQSFDYFWHNAPWDFLIEYNFPVHHRHFIKLPPYKYRDEEPDPDDYYPSIDDVDIEDVCAALEMFFQIYNASAPKKHKL